GTTTVTERSIYGETLTDAAARNVKGKLYRQLDGSGLTTYEQYDFKGNLVTARKRLASAYVTEPDWPDYLQPGDSTLPSGVDALLVSEVLTRVATYDALNRKKSQTEPDGSATFWSYNEGGLIKSIQKQLPGDASPSDSVSRIDYNEKSQRTQILL